MKFLLSCQIQYPYWPPCQPVRGHSGVSEPPGLYADKPVWILPWKDGLSSGPGERPAQYETGAWV